MTGAFSEETGQLEERFERAPSSRLFAPLADAYRKEGAIERAIELCEQGLERYPDYASAHVILGKCFYDKGATERAKAEFERVVEIDPENMVALRFLGNILLAEGDRDGAASFFRTLLSIDPTNGEAASALGELENEFRVREIDLGSNADGSEGERSRDLATMTLAGIYASQGYYNKALGIYRDVLKREPDNAEARSMLERLGQLVDGDDRERDLAFDEDVLTISVDDVGEELAVHTAGPGGSTDSAAAGHGEIADAVRELDEEERRGGDPTPATGSPEAPRESGARRERPGRKETNAPPAADRAAAAPTPPEMADFRNWLNRLKGDAEN